MVCLGAVEIVTTDVCASEKTQVIPHTSCALGLINRAVCGHACGRPSIDARLLKNKLGKAITALRKSGAPDAKIVIEEKKCDVELGENIGHITEFGKNYSRTQLYRLFKYVGRYFLGLPAFGPNILRSMHVTGVLIKAIKQGKKYDDPEIQDLFALARHGQFYRENNYNMVQADLQALDAKTFQGENHGLAGTIGEDDDQNILSMDRTAYCDNFLDLFGGQGFSKLQREQTNTGITPSLQSVFGPHGLAGFIQQLSVALRGVGGPSPMCIDNDPGFLADKKRLEEINVQIARK